MPVFKSSLDIAGAACAENRAHMLALVARHDELRDHSAAASGRAGPRFAKRGQLLPRERLGLLLDAMPNVVVEFGAIIAELGRQPKTANQFFTKYQDRILFFFFLSNLNKPFFSMAI